MPNNREKQKEILEKELESSRKRLNKLIAEAQSKKDEAEENDDSNNAKLFDDLIFQYSSALQKTFEDQLQKLDDSAEIQKIIDSFKDTNNKINGTLKKLEKIKKYAKWAKLASNILDDLIQAAAKFAK